MAPPIDEKQVAKLLLLLQGLAVDEWKPSAAALHIAGLLINHPHAFSSTLQREADDPLTRLRKGLLALMTFELHFLQSKAVELRPDPPQVQYIFHLVLVHARVPSNKQTRADVRAVFSELRLQRSNWLVKQAARRNRPQESTNAAKKTLLEALDVSSKIRHARKPRRSAYHATGRLPYMTEKDWPRHLATRCLQAEEMAEQKDLHMAVLLRKRATWEQIDAMVALFFQSFDSVDDRTVRKAKNAMGAGNVPGKNLHSFTIMPAVPVQTGP